MLFLLFNLIFFVGNWKLDFDEFLWYVKYIYKDFDEIRCNFIEVFKVFDVNKDGFIFWEEFKVVLIKMGEKFFEKEFDEMVWVVDSNGDGRIDYEGKKYLCLFDFLILFNKKIMNFILKKCNDYLFKLIKNVSVLNMVLIIK